MSRQGDARARALLGLLVRARTRFDIAALTSLNPDLSPTQRAAALAQEQRYARAWEDKARERIRRRLAIDSSQESALSLLPRERLILASHLAMTGARMTARGDLARLRAAGETHGYWLRSDRPWHESCQECRSRSGRLWSLDFLERYGPPRHPHCGCKIVSPRAARAWGLIVRDPVPIAEAVRETWDESEHPRGRTVRGTNDGSFRPHLGVPGTHGPRPGPPKGATQRSEEDELIAELVHRIYGLSVFDAPSKRKKARAVAAVAEATSRVMEAIGRIERDARSNGLGAAAAEQLGAVLREATVPVWREADHPRWPKGHPLGGQFRRKVDVGEVPNVLRPGLAALARAAQTGDFDAVNRAYDDMVKAARTLKGIDRGDAIRFATRARAAVFNPTGRRSRTGEQVDDVPVPLGIPSEGRTGGWAELSPFRAVFMWEMAPGELGPEHDGIVHALKRSPAFSVTELPNGAVRLQSAPQRNEAQANGDARILENRITQLRAMRVSAPGVDLADTRPIDPVEEEGAPVLAQNERTWYPGVSTRMLGDAAENIIDAAATRMRELGLLEDDATVEFPSLASRDRNSPLDWIMGARGIEVKAQSMRSLTPGRQQRAPTIDSGNTRADKIAVVTNRNLRPSLVHAITDLDNDVAHLFLHDYPDPDTMFKEIRPPQAIIDRLVAGTLRPGDDETASTGKHAGRGEKRFIFLGTFRLGYNPYLARFDTPPDLPTMRQRAAAKPPLDVGVRRKVAPPIDRVTAAQAVSTAVVDKTHDLDERNAQIAAMYQQGAKQADLATEFGITQPQVSAILKKLGVPTRRGRGARPGISDALPRAATVAKRGGGGDFDPGQLTSNILRRPVRDKAAKGKGAAGRRAALRREALAHREAGLSVRQIARKMGLLPDYVQTLLDEPDRR